ncbi:hypothetical protein EGI22_14290 [Lacihabitans sp. LS3-19]|uniref:DUF6249 domain-containing protein n=1 Tax=Lacihabitans sp. LS3-19 TaxID=2487335 RepID=UPI0020CD51D7|nr:DUF6249 domain-containing protein [Lacihabitans sp. LS3-19]MCP9769084.1 hypothetical protein [Lacihabitans sp. LS3-19]
MKKSKIGLLILLATVQAFAQNKTITATQSSPSEPMTSEPIAGIILPILFIIFLVFMIISLIKYFLEYRLKNKLIDKGMAEQLSAYLLNKNDEEQKNEVIKLAILFCGIGIGFIMTYLTTPIHIHSLAIMAFSIGLSYLAYFFYLRS